MPAHAVKSEREKAIATGCDEFDAKPIDFALIATVQRVTRNDSHSLPVRPSRPLAGEP
jgi:CheY-like chemotaxis protein